MTVKTSGKILGFLQLPNGWHLGGSRAIDFQVVEQAQNVVQHATSVGFTQSDAFPGPDGSVLVAFYEGLDSYVQVRVENDLRFEVMYERSDEEVLRRDCETVGEVHKLLIDIYGDICRNRFASRSTFLNTLIINGTGLSTTFSNRHQTAVESPVLASTAQNGGVARSAHIFNNSTHQLQVYPAHSGGSRTRSYRMSQAS